MDYRFRWNERLHRKGDFSRVIREGRRVVAGGLTLWVYQHQDHPGAPRLGLAVSRAFGGGPQRNRLKRLLREVFRLNKHRLPRGVDLVFGARPMPGTLKLERIQMVVMTLWTKAGLLSAAA